MSNMRNGKNITIIILVLYTLTNLILLASQIIALDEYKISTTISSFLLFFILFKYMVKGSRVAKIIMIVLSIMTLIGCLMSFEALFIDSLELLVVKPLEITLILSAYSFLIIFLLFTTISLLFSKDLRLYLKGRRKLEIKYRNYISKMTSKND